MTQPLILPRSAWTSTAPGFQQVKPSRRIDPSEVVFFALHWPGDGAKSYANLTKAQAAAKIRGYRDYHVNSRDWADIGYPFVVDMAGRIWEAAGTKYAAAHSASASYSRANNEGMAALLLVGENDKPSAAMVRAVNDLTAHLRRTFPNMRTLYGHQQVKGASTSCPGPHVMAAIGSGQFTITGGGSMAVPRMASPAVGRFTSGYGPRNLAIAPWHAGVDIANSVGTPIHAAFAGKVVDAGWGIVKYRSGNGILIRNPDGERQYYGHLSRIRVKVGQTVKVGQRIGDMGATGNVTGPHLHFETWSNSSQSSHYDPKLAFDKHGVTIGSKPNVSGGATPAPGPTPTKDWFDMATQKELESALWNVLNRDITVGGSTGKRYKGGTAPLYSLIRDGAYALDAAQDIPRQVMMYDISVGGSTKKAIGKDSTTAAALLRYAAAAVYDGRNQHAQSTARQDALQAAVAELASERGVDAKVITAAIDKAVAAAISELGTTLDAEV